MYSVSRKNCENTAAPISSPARLEPDSVRERNIRIGSSGACERSSMATKATISAAEAASSAIVSVVPQPCWTARVIAYTSSISPPVIEMAPGTSKCRWVTPATLSRTSRGVSASTSAPTGTLMKKIQDQSSELVSAPPSSTPAAPPLPETAPQIPSAKLRSLPSGKVVVRIDSAAGESSAAPSPWRARKAISEPSDQASPSSSELTLKSVSPAMNRRRRPSRSAMRPPSSRTPPNMIE